VTVTLWAIWTCRRKAIHEEVFQSPLSTNGFVNSYIKKLQEMKSKSSTSNANRQSGRAEPRWIQPTSGFDKINYDAVVSKTGGLGLVGAICRAAHGLYLGASAIIFRGITDPATLEFMACREAISLAGDLNLYRIVVASDCKEVFTDIAQETKGRYAAIVDEIKARAVQLQNCSFVHELRASSFESHNLAKHALSLDIACYTWLANPYSVIV
jgi:hypothetical protein